MKKESASVCESTFLFRFATVFPYAFWALLPRNQMLTAFNDPSKVYEAEGVETVMRCDERACECERAQTTRGVRECAKVRERQAARETSPHSRPHHEESVRK